MKTLLECGCDCGPGKCECAQTTHCDCCSEDNENCCCWCRVDSKGMGAAESESLAQGFSALGEPARVKLLNQIIRSQECCVCDMTVSSELSQPTVSHHLAKLKRAGLVTSESRGRRSIYRANPQAISRLGNALSIQTTA